MFSTVVRASGSTTTSRAEPRQALAHQLGLGVRARRPAPSPRGRRRRPRSRSRRRARAARRRPGEGRRRLRRSSRARRSTRVTSVARRSQRKKSNVPITVSTSFTAFLPRSFDSPLLRARACAPRPPRRGDPARFRRRSASTSGAPLTYGCAMTGIAVRLTAAIPLVGSWKRRPSRTCIAFCEQADPEPAGRARQVAVGRVALAVRRTASRPRRRTRPDGRARAAVGARRPGAGRRRRRVRSTRSRARAPRGSRPRSPRAGRGSRRTRQHVGAVRHARPTRVASVEPSSMTSTSRPGSSVCELVEHGREVRLLVPGWDEDERVRRQPRGRA